MNKSHLLINEPALQVLPTLAKLIGLEEAIILQQLHYWLNNPKVQGREEDGQKWIFNTYQEWHENFPFWTADKIQRIFLNLEKAGLVISARLDAKKHDQTKFYRLNYDALCTFDDAILPPSNTAELHVLNKVLTETTTETTSKSERYSATAKKLENLTGALKGTDAPLISAWVEKHEDKWIDSAIDIAKAKGARSSAYVDRILIGWEANGYPKSREQQVADRKTEKRTTKQTQTRAPLEVL